MYNKEGAVEQQKNRPVGNVRQPVVGKRGWRVPQYGRCKQGRKEGQDS